MKEVAYDTTYRLIKSVNYCPVLINLGNLLKFSDMMIQQRMNLIEYFRVILVYQNSKAF